MRGDGRRESRHTGDSVLYDPRLAVLLCGLCVAAVQVSQAHCEAVDVSYGLFLSYVYLFQSYLALTYFIFLTFTYNLILPCRFLMSYFKLILLYLTLPYLTLPQFTLSLHTLSNLP